jgi:hypothetical protein
MSESAEATPEEQAALELGVEFEKLRGSRAYELFREELFKDAQGTFDEFLAAREVQDIFRAQGAMYAILRSLRRVDDAVEERGRIAQELVARYEQDVQLAQEQLRMDAQQRARRVHGSYPA